MTQSQRRYAYLDLRGLLGLLGLLSLYDSLYFVAQSDDENDHDNNRNEQTHNPKQTITTSATEHQYHQERQQPSFESYLCDVPNSLDDLSLLNLLAYVAKLLTTMGQCLCVRVLGRPCGVQFNRVARNTFACASALLEPAGHAA